MNLCNGGKKNGNKFQRGDVVLCLGGISMGKHYLIIERVSGGNTLVNLKTGELRDGGSFDLNHSLYSKVDCCLTIKQG